MGGGGGGVVGRIPTCCARKTELQAMKSDNPLARKATFHEVVTWECVYEEACHLPPLPICLPHADASEDDKEVQKGMEKEKDGERKHRIMHSK